MRVYKNTEGLQLIFEGSVSLTDATVLRVYYRKPSGSTGYWTATVEGGTNLAYTLQSGDLNEAGEWVLQPYVELGTWKGYAEAHPFTVYEPFDY